MQWGARTIVLEAAAQQVADAAADEFDRFEEAFMALQWLLARSPVRGKRRMVDATEWRVYVQASDPLAKTPAIWVLFTFSDDDVIIHKINVLPPNDD